VEVSKFLDHGTANPIVARLTSQTFAILDACNLSKEAADKIKVVYMQALTKTLVWCGEIAMRYQGEFVKQLEACRRRPPSAIVTVPSITAPRGRVPEFSLRSEKLYPGHAESVQSSLRDCV
jgi:hypothetical protein